MSENLRSRKRRDMPEGVKDRTSESSSGLTND